MLDINQIIQKIVSGVSVTTEEAYCLQKSILAGQVDTDRLVKIFEFMQDRIATTQELQGFLQASVESMIAVNVEGDVLDTCSTGGDGINVFNISTLSAIVCASGGVKVAKHGNKSVSSKCGSFDLLEKIGLDFNLTSEQVAQKLKNHNLVFLFAPLFHPSFRFAKEARTKFAKKTYFNFLGPLINPVKVKFQVIGVSDPKMTLKMGQALLGNGSKKVWILIADNGLNEISPVGLTKVWEFELGKAKPEEFVINPNEYGIFHKNCDDILCDNIDQAEEIFWSILQNKAPKIQIDTVCLNAAAGFYVVGKVSNFFDGVLLAKDLISSGKALRQVQDYLNPSKN